MDEWIAWNANAGAQAPKFPDVRDYAQFMDGREGGDQRKSAYDPDFRQRAYDVVDSMLAFGEPAERWAPETPLAQPVKFSDLGAAVGGSLGSGTEQLLNKINANPSAVSPSGDPAFQPGATTPVTGLEQVGEEVGRTIPRSAAGFAGVAALGPIGMVPAVADAHLQGYGPYADPIAGFVAPATMAATVPAAGFAGRAAEKGVMKAVLPDFQDLVQAPSRQYGQAFGQAWKTNPALETAITGARLGAENVAATGVSEVGRVAEGAMNLNEITFRETGPGKTAIFDPVSIAANTVGSLATLPLEAKMMPARAVQEGATMQAFEVADKARVRLAGLNDTRGQRISDTHKRIFTAARDGQDVGPMLEELRSHYMEAAAARQPTENDAAQVLMSMSEEANAGGFDLERLNHIIAAVEGRFDALVKANPQGETPSGAAIAQLVKSGQLPKLTNEWMRNNFKQAYEQAVGDGPALTANLINRIVAEYEDRIPAALQAYKAMPRDIGLQRSQLDMQVEADKDRSYVEALIALQPHMKGKVLQRGRMEGDKEIATTALDEAIYQRDMELSSATQGNQLSAESAAWGTYDAWKDAVIRLAATYDPVTRTGEYVPSRRLADGEVIQGSSQRLSIEDLVEKIRLKTGQEKYKTEFMSTRSVGQSVRADTSLDELLQYVQDKSEPLGDENQEMQTLADADKADAFQRARAKLKRTSDELEQSATVERTSKVVASREADELGLTGDEKAAYVQQALDELTTAEESGFGFDVSATDKPQFYDIALWLTRKVEQTDLDTLWTKYGGQPLFGKGHLTPGKKELFKDAVLAKIEMDVMGKDTDHITATQERFYNAWRTIADVKSGTAAPLAKTWEKKREQLRHALRLYWRAQSESRADHFALYDRFLDDRPDYQTMLRAASARFEKPSGSSIEGVSGMDIDSTSTLPQNRYVTQYAGTTDAKTDALRMFRGQARRRMGMNEMDADRFALSAYKIASAFPENSKFGSVISPESFTGINVPQRGERPWIGINFERLMATSDSPMVASVRGLQILAHELAHNYTFFDPDKPSVWQQQRIDAHAKLRGLFTEMGVDATYDLLNSVLPDLFFPPQFKPTSVSSLTYPGADFAQEAVSRMMEFYVLGAMARGMKDTGRKSASTMEYGFLWLPDDVQAFTRLAFRDIANFMGAVDDYYSRIKPDMFGTMGMTFDPRAVRQSLRPILKFSEDFINGADKKASEYETLGKTLLSKIVAAGSVDWDDPILVRTSRVMSQRELTELAREGKVSYAVEEKDPFGFEETQGELFGVRATDPGKFMTADQKRLGARVPAWSHWLGQAYQMLRRYEKVGVKLADPAARILNGLEPAYWRLTQVLHKPFIITDNKGNIKYDPGHPVQQILQNKHPQAKRAHAALEKLRLWSVAQETPVVTRDASGKAVIHPEAQKLAAQELAGLDPLMQQGVLEGMVSLVEGYRNAAEMRLSAEYEAISTQVAKFFMLRDKGMFYDTAFTHAQRGVNAGVAVARGELMLKAAVEAVKTLQEKTAGQPEMLGSPELQMAQQNLMQRQAELSQLRAEYVRSLDGLNSDQVAAMESYVMGPNGVANGLMEMANLFKSREGWFMSEARPGRFITYAKTPEGKKYANGSREERFARRLEQDLAKQGYTDIETVDREAPDSWELFNEPDETVNSFIKIEQNAWREFLHKVQGSMTPEEFAALEADAYTPGMASQKFIQNRSINRYLQPRKLVAGREALNSFEVFQDYTRRLVGTVARRGVRQQLDLLLRDPRARLNGEFQTSVREAADTLMQPVSDRFAVVRSGVTAMFLGMPNIVSPIVESTQMLTTVFPELVREDGSYSSAVKRFMHAPRVLGEQWMQTGTLAHRRVIESAKAKEFVAPDAMTKEESIAYYFQRSKQEGRFQHGVVQQDMTARDFELLNQWSFGMGMGDVAPKSAGELSKDVIYRLSQALMVPYSKVSATNNKIAFVAALDLFYDKGFRGQELYEKAHVFKDRATFGGGKPNEVGFVSKISNPRTRSWFSLLNTLQRYSFGSTTQIKDYIADVIGTTKLSALERTAAAKAVTHALATQFVLAGAMGVPGALIASALLEKLMGVDVKQAARSTFFELSKRIGADDPLAVMLANVAQNGAPGQFLGIDVSSRFSLNSFLGFDAFEGWDFANFGGPTVGVVERLVKATQHAAKGDMVKSLKYAVPPSLSPAVDIMSQADEPGGVGLRTANGRLIRPLSGPEKVKYAAGIRPYWMKQFRDEQSALQMANDSYLNAKTQKIDQAADSLLKGDSKPSWDWVREHLKSTPAAGPEEARTALKSVVDRALVQTNAQDLLSRVSVGNEAAATSIAQSFGDTGRQSEVGLLQQRAQLTGQLGLDPSQVAGPDSILRAAMVDALVKQGKTRQEALRAVQLLGF